MENELSKALSHEKIRYDAQCKRVLSQKVILAWILQKTVREFKRMDIKEIIPCIEGDPEVSGIHTDPGQTNPEKISGMQNEDIVPGEGGDIL